MDGDDGGCVEPAIHIHEDDWGMRNLYPLAARSEAAADLEESIAARERNRDPSGFGWSDIHLIKPPSVNYVDAGLRVEDAAAALAPIMPRIRRFYATISGAIGSEDRDPYGSYEEDAWCFGLGPDCYIKLEPKGDLVERIWFDLAGDPDPSAPAAMRAAIEAIDSLVPSVVVDYWRDVEGRAGDRDFLDLHFAGREPDEAGQ